MGEARVPHIPCNANLSQRGLSWWFRGAALPGGPGGWAALFGVGETWGRLARYGRPTAGE